MSRRWLAALVVAAAVVIAAPGVLAAAQTRLGLNGGRPSDWPFLAPLLAGQGLTQQGWLDFASRVGENWLPGTTPVAVDYPAQLGPLSGPSALTTDQSTAIGQQNLHAAILRELAKGEPIVVAGLSEGTLVIDQELRYLQNDPTAPPAQDITFYVFGDMGRGLGQMYLPGVTIPFVGQTFSPLPDSQYDTVVVNEQWDGWANPPDRPWNLLAVLNAVMGAVYTVNGSNDHSQTSLDSMADAVLVSKTTSSLGGTTTTYMIPREQLPLTRPLLQLGVPTWAVDEIDKLLMPLIQTGYSTLTPNLGPHIDHGQLVWTSPPAPAAEPVSTAAQSDVTPVQTGIASTDAAPDAVATVSAPAENAGQERRAERRTPGDVDTGALLNEDTKSAAPEQPQPTDVREPADPEPVAAVDQPEPPRADPVGADGSVKEDPEPTTTHRPRPDRVREPADPADASDGTLKNGRDPGSAHRPRPFHVRGGADSDGTPDVPSQPTPAGGDTTGSDSAEKSPSAANAA